jgi:hypothetical protein
VRAQNIDEYYNNLEVGEIIKVAIPLEYQEEPAKKFEFWGPWFYPTRDRVRELAPSAYNFIESITFDKEPSNPKEMLLFIESIDMATKSGCNP